MNPIRDQIQKLNIEVASSNGAVVATLTAARGIEVEFEPSVLEEYDEESLAQEVEEALASAVQGAIEYAELIKHGDSGRESKDLTAQEKSIKAAVEKIDVTAESPRGLMTIDWLGQDDFVVTFHEGAFRKLNHASLTGDANATIFALSHQRKKETEEIYRHHFRRNEPTRP